MSMSSPSNFQHAILPQDRWFDLKLREIWRYRDLLFLFVRRDFVAKYKQTILGPLWFFITPIFQALTMTLVFGNMAGLSTDGIPPLLFYLSGVTAWSYFSQCLTSTSNTFTQNAALFGKVYFPRAVTPLSVIISNLIQFGIGMLLFFGFYLFYLFQGIQLQPNALLLLLPALVVLMGFMGLGLGMITSSLTTKYRDLQNLIAFGVQLLMYATPVILPLSAVPDKYRWIMMINPMTGVIETFKHGFFGIHDMQWGLLIYSSVFTLVVFFFGLAIFNRTEKNFMDTV